MREKKSGALSKVQKIKKRLSHSFGRLCKYQLFCIIVSTIYLLRPNTRSILLGLKLNFDALIE